LAAAPRGELARDLPCREPAQRSMIGPGGDHRQPLRCPRREGDEHLVACGEDASVNERRAQVLGAVAAPGAVEGYVGELKFAAREF